MVEPEGNEEMIFMYLWEEHFRKNEQQIQSTQLTKWGWWWVKSRIAASCPQLNSWFMFPSVSVMRKFRGEVLWIIKDQFIISQFRTLGVCTVSCWVRVEVLAGLCSFLGALEKDPFPGLSSVYRLSAFLGSWLLPLSSRATVLYFSNHSSQSHHPLLLSSIFFVAVKYI